VVSANVNPIAYTEWGRCEAVLIRVACHCLLGFLHVVTEEFVVLIEVDGEMASA